MRSLKSLTSAAMALPAILLFASASTAHAEKPAYLHAISDLRTAREYLQQDTRPRYAEVRNNVIVEIGKAIDDMKRAAVDDGKNPNHTPPPQSEGDPRIPVRSAIKLLEEARHDVEHGRDVPENEGLQVRSLQHIDNARHALEEIVR